MSLWYRDFYVGLSFDEIKSCESNMNKVEALMFIKSMGIRMIQDFLDKHEDKGYEWIMDSNYTITFIYDTDNEEHDSFIEKIIKEHKLHEFMK